MQDDVLSQARFIFTAGRLIHAQMIKVQSRLLAATAGPLGGELSVPQMDTISIVRTKGPLAMGALAEHLGISAPSASAMVERLVEKGILVRAHSTADRRKVVVSISPEAVREIEIIEAGILHLFETLVERLGPDTTAKWCEVLATIQKLLAENDLFHPAPNAGADGNRTL